MNKPFRGFLADWSKHPTPHGLGFYLRCKFVDHPYFAGERGHTSYVVKHDKETGIVETRNSIYHLYGPERKSA